MSTFWEQRLGRQQQAAPPPQPAPSSKPWWMPQASAQPVQQQSQHPVPIPQQTGQQGSVTEDGTSNFGDLLRQTEYTTEKAQSAKDTTRCPECDSANYVADKTDARSMKHCFDCGYNPRFSQSMAGITGTGQNIPVKTARVQRMNTNTFNISEQTIIAHI